MDTPPPSIYTLSLHDALPISFRALGVIDIPAADTYPGEDDFTWRAERHRRKVLVNDIDTHIVNRAAKRDAFSDRKSTRLNSSHLGISYAVFCLKKKKTQLCS